MATLIAPAQHSPVDDADVLRKACQGFGTDEKAIISVIGHRNAHQRTQIRQAYEMKYHEDLIKRLESELSGDLERAVYRWILEPADREAVLANVAIRRGKPDYAVIVEISCVHSPEELLEVRRAYKNHFKRCLEEDVAAHTTGDIRKLLVALVSAYRYEGDEIDKRLASSEAEILHDSISKKEFNHEEITRILSTRSKLQIMATFNHFRENHGNSITKILQGDPADEFLSILRTAIRCINNPIKYYEKTLRNAMKGRGTHEDALTRVIVTRAEKDLKEIKELYFNRNSVSLNDAVKKEISGDYQAFLLALLGNGHA